ANWLCFAFFCFARRGPRRRNNCKLLLRPAGHPVTALAPGLDSALDQSHDGSMRGTFLPLFVLACAAFPLQAQLPLGFGLKGGARLTDFTESSSDVTTADHVYTIGPYAELRLPAGFSVEVDLLYKRSGSTLQTDVR